MDEPTSNIDQQTEEIIYDSLKRLKTKSTIIMIAHKNQPFQLRIMLLIWRGTVSRLGISYEW